MRILLLCVALILGGCVKVLKVTPAGQPTKVLKAGECYEFDTPIYYVDGTVGTMHMRACNLTKAEETK